MLPRASSSPVAPTSVVRKVRGTRCSAMAKEGSVLMQADRQPASVATCNSVEFSARNAGLRSLQPSHRVDYDDSYYRIS